MTACKSLLEFTLAFYFLCKAGGQLVHQSLLCDLAWVFHSHGILVEKTFWMPVIKTFYLCLSHGEIYALYAPP